MNIKVYQNKHQSDAIKDAIKDAEKHGYLIDSQSWQEGKSGCLRFLLLGPFAFFVRPKGRLTVVTKPRPETAS